MADTHTYNLIDSDVLIAAFSNGLKLSGMPAGVRYSTSMMGNVSDHVYDAEHYYFRCNNTGVYMHTDYTGRPSKLEGHVVVVTDYSFNVTGTMIDGAIVDIINDANGASSPMAKISVFDVIFNEVKQCSTDIERTTSVDIQNYIVGDYSFVLGHSTASTGTYMLLNGSEVYDKDSSKSILFGSSLSTQRIFSSLLLSETSGGEYTDVHGSIVTGGRTLSGITNSILMLDKNDDSPNIHSSLVLWSSVDAVDKDTTESRKFNPKSFYNSLVIGAQDNLDVSNLNIRYSSFWHTASGTQSGQWGADPTVEYTLENVHMVYSKCHLGCLSQSPKLRNYADAFIFSSASAPELFGIDYTQADPRFYRPGMNELGRIRYGHPMIYTDGIGLLGGPDYALLKIGTKVDVQYKNEVDGYVIHTGTDKCSYAGQTLIMDAIQEMDGTMHAKVGYPHSPAKEENKFLCGDGTWKEVLSGSAALLEVVRVVKLECAYIASYQVGLYVKEENSYGSSYADTWTTEQYHPTDDVYAAKRDIKKDGSNVSGETGTFNFSMTTRFRQYYKGDKENGNAEYGTARYDATVSFKPQDKTIYFYCGTVFEGGGGGGGDYLGLSQHLGSLVLNLAKPTEADLGKSFIIRVKGYGPSANRFSGLYINGVFELYDNGINAIGGDSFDGPLYGNAPLTSIKEIMHNYQNKLTTIGTSNYVLNGEDKASYSNQETIVYPQASIEGSAMYTTHNFLHTLYPIAFLFTVVKTPAVDAGVVIDSYKYRVTQIAQSGVDSLQSLLPEDDFKPYATAQRKTIQKATITWETTSTKPQKLIYDEVAHEHYSEYEKSSTSIEITDITKTFNDYTGFYECTLEITGLTNGKHYFCMINTGSYVLSRDYFGQELKF